MTQPTLHAHKVTFPAYNVRRMIRAIRMRSKRPGVTARRHNTALAVMRWLQGEIDSRGDLESVELLAGMESLEMLAKVLADEGLFELSREIIRQTSEGD